jgi:hypothetical protein
MTMSQARRLAAIEKALEQLLQKANHYILVRADDTMEEAEKWHREQGLFDPERQQPFFIMSKIPGRARGNPWERRANEELPSIQHVEEITPMPHAAEHYQLPPERKPERKRTKIHYPEFVY